MNPYNPPNKIEIDKELVAIGLKKFKDSLIWHQYELKTYLDNTNELIDDLDLSNHKTVSIVDVFITAMLVLIFTGFIFIVGVSSGLENRNYWLSIQDNIKTGNLWKSPLNP